MDFNAELFRNGAARIDRLIEFMKFLRQTASLTDEEVAVVMPMVERQNTLLQSAEANGATLELVIELAVLNARIGQALGIGELETIGQAAE